MNFYLLRPREDLSDDEENNPWKPWYDKAFGFVIKAKDENEARKIAQEHAGDETTLRHGVEDYDFNNKIWTKAKYATCIPLEEYDDDDQVIIRDYARG